jgi:hypothetical protein
LDNVRILGTAMGESGEETCYSTVRSMWSIVAVVLYGTIQGYASTRTEDMYRSEVERQLRLLSSKVLLTWI